MRDSASVIRQQRWEVIRARASRLLEYDSNQPRDEDGKWTSDGGSGDGSEGPGTSGGAGQSQVNAGSNVPNQAVGKAKAAIASIPAAHRELLKNVSVDIVSNTDDFPEHMQRANGFYDPDNKQIKIAETVASYPGGNPIWINVAKAVSHELGHAYDDATGAGNSLDATDVADSVRRTRGTTATERINARYFTSSSKEIFGELYALAHSPEKAEKYFGIPRARAERIWAKPLAQVRAMGEPAKRFASDIKTADALLRDGWVIEDDGSVYAVINGSIYDVDAAGSSLTKLPAGEYSDEQLKAALAKLDQ